MALQYQRGVGRPERTRMLTVRGGYHGDTFGAMSVCDPVGGMHSMFTRRAAAAGLRRPAAGGRGRRTPPGPRRSGRSPPQHADELAGIIVEPLLQGAGGMHVYPAACLRVMREVADEHGLVLVFDEIATGFGRTGTLFAADAAGVVARHHVRRQGAHRRLPQPGRGAVHDRGRARAVRVGVRRADARADLHGQPARLRGRAGQPRPARAPATGSATSRGSTRGLAAGLAACREPARRRRRAHDRRGRASSSSTTRSTSTKATEAALDAGRVAAAVPRPVYTMPPYVCTDDDVAGSVPPSRPRRWSGERR